LNPPHPAFVFLQPFFGIEFFPDFKPFFAGVVSPVEFLLSGGLLFNPSNSRLCASGQIFIFNFLKA